MHCIIEELRQWSLHYLEAHTRRSMSESHAPVFKSIGPKTTSSRKYLQEFKTTNLWKNQVLIQSKQPKDKKIDAKEMQLS